MTPRKKTGVQPLTPETPIYPIGVAARLLGVHPRTLRIYEEEELIRPVHQGRRRVFSENDIRWITCIREIIHERGISIAGLKKLLKLVPCWDIKDCPVDVHGTCSALVDPAAPGRVGTVADTELGPGPAGGKAGREKTGS